MLMSEERAGHGETKKKSARSRRLVVDENVPSAKISDCCGKRRHVKLPPTFCTSYTNSKKNALGTQLREGVLEIIHGEADGVARDGCSGVGRRAYGSAELDCDSRSRRGAWNNGASIGAEDVHKSLWYRGHELWRRAGGRAGVWVRKAQKKIITSCE